MSGASPMSRWNSRRVVRSDGELYESSREAARALVDEMGCCDVATVSSAIRAVCNGLHHRRTAYGYEWRYVDAAGG